MSSEQRSLIAAMHGGPRKLKRPQTAATTNKKDENRIKKKLQILENIERQIDEDIEEFNFKKESKKSQKGIRLTKELCLETS